MTSAPPTTSGDDATTLLRRDRPPPVEDLDGQLHLAQLRRELASAVSEPVHFRQWDVARRLGHGGMGSVYLARHRQLNRWVALKVLSPRADRANAVHDARLIREAQALATIRHKNVVEIHQVDTSGDQTVIEMEYVDGPTLRRWQVGRAWREIVAGYADAGDGLAAIHRAGFVHRDIKPDNILRSENGTVKVADLGLASAVQSPTSDTALDPGTHLVAGHLTADGALVGTLAYMAPEVIVGAPASAGSDLFGLAASLFEAVHGVLPFQGATAEAQAAAIRSGRLARPVVGSSTPAWLGVALRRALACDPDRRHDSVEAFVRELRRGLHRRRRRVLLALVGATLVGLPGLTLWLSTSPPDPCMDSGQPFLTLWDPATRFELQRHADASPTPPNRQSFNLLTSTLDDTTRALASTRTELCAAEASLHTSAPSRRQSEFDLHLRQRACLDYTYRHLRALVGRLRSTPIDLARHYADAVDAIEALPRCEDSQDLAHWLLSPGTDELDAALGEMLAQAEALESTGDYAEAASLAELSVQASEHASGLRRAEALFRLGHILGQEYRYTEAYGILVKAREAALGIGHDELFCQSVVFLAKLTANVGVDPATSASELGLANACTERISARSILLRADLLEARGLLALAVDDPGAAIRWHDEALALRLEHLGDLNPQTAKSVHNLANALAAAGRDDEASRRYHEALALHERLFGRDHVEVADVLFDLGDFFRASNPDAARAVIARASAIYSSHQAVRRLASAKLQVMLALIELGGTPSEDQLGKAAEHLRQAEQLQHDATLGPSHPDRTLLLRAKGALALRQGDFSAAAQAYGRATRLLARRGAPDSEIFSSILDEVEAAYGRGDFAAVAKHAHDEGQPLAAYVSSLEPPDERGRIAWYFGISLAQEAFVADSIEFLQIARTAYQAQAEPGNVAELGWTIAQAIISAPARADEARGLANSSLAHYQAVGELATAAQISRWLKRNASSPRPTTSEP